MMDFGVHIPQIVWEGGQRHTLERLTSLAMTAQQAGFSTVTANDHLVYRKPWLDGPMALAAVASAAPTLRLMTSVSLPVVRGPFALAKTLGALDVLSGGRVEAGFGPGSSEADYAVAQVPFAERWARFDESVAAIRAVWDPKRPPFAGRFYDTSGIDLGPHPVQPGGPPIWIGSWGSTAGMRRVARLADGWLASGYNTTPESFIASLALLRELLVAEGREPSGFPTTLATTWMCLTEDDAEARSVAERISEMVRRPVEEVIVRIPVGSAAWCVDLLGRYQEAGLGRVLLWPVVDEVGQIERFAADVMPQLRSA